MNAKSFRCAAWVTCVAWVVTAVLAGVVAVAGVLTLTGRTDARLAVEVPFIGTVVHQPSWGVATGGEACPALDLRDVGTSPWTCFGFFLHDEEPPGDTSVLTSGPRLRPTTVDLQGTVDLVAPPGWNRFVAADYAMTTLGLLVLAFVLFQLWRVLRRAAADAPFGDDVPRRLTLMGAAVVGWQVAQPLLWLFLSPKALDYDVTAAGYGPPLSFTSMEPGLQPVVIALGVLLVLLGRVFARGARLERDAALTV